MADESMQEDAIVYLQKLFEGYGLGSLAKVIADYVRQGYSGNTITLLLQETPEYKDRFAGNIARQKAGLPVLPPNEYLAAESAYRQIMRASGLPEGYYDNPSDFANLIGKDVSPAELKGRVDIASQVIQNSDPLVTSQLEQYYGLDAGHMIAHVLDPNAALPFIQKQVAAAQFGAEASRQKLSVDLGMAEQYANMGISQQQAQQGFSAIGQMLPAAQMLSDVYGQQYGQSEAMAEVFGQSAEAAKTRKKLTSLEQSAFSGQSGVNQTSLAGGTQGAF